MLEISSSTSSFFEAARKEELRKNLGKFFVRSFEHLNPDTRLTLNWHIDCLSEYLTGCFNKELKRLIINIPFRMLKSSMCSIAFPAWGLGLNPALKFMCVSYADTLSTDLSVRSRQLVESDWYHDLFPNLKLLKDQNQKTRFDTTQNGYRYSTSTGGGAIGMGANFLIVDDYLSSRMAKSDQERETALMAFNPSFKTRLNNQNDDVIIVIEQRLHEKDLTGMLLKEGGFEHLCLQGKFEKRKIFSFGNFEKVAEEGELLQEDRLSDKVLDELQKSLGSEDYAAQIQQNPMAAGGNIVKSAWFKRYDLSRFPNIEEIINFFDTIVSSFDTASSEKETADPTAIGIWGIKGNDAYLLFVLNERMQVPDLEREGERLINHYKPHHNLIENKGSGIGLIQKYTRELPFGIVKIDPKGEKSMRLRNNLSKIENGRIFLPEKADWLFDYETQMTKFPKAEHDDMVDMTSQFLEWFSNRTASFEFFEIDT